MDVDQGPTDGRTRSDDRLGSADAADDLPVPAQVVQRLPSLRPLPLHSRQMSSPVPGVPGGASSPGAICLRSAGIDWGAYMPAPVQPPCRDYQRTSFGLSLAISR